MSERPAYVIGHITVKNTPAWAEYCKGVPGTLAESGGELVLRGKRHTVWDGTHHATDTVVLHFPSLDAARRWHDSAAYQALIPLRHRAADVDLILFEG